MISLYPSFSPIASVKVPIPDGSPGFICDSSVNGTVYISQWMSIHAAGLYAADF